jgi:SRSO17 transposase
MTVDEMMRFHRPLREQAWKRYRIKDGEKGPMVWEIKHVLTYPRNEERLPEQAYHLIVARNVMEPGILKYFASNAPVGSSVQTMLLVAFSRWRVERCFEDEKGELGLDHYEGRRYQGLKRHMIITAVSHLFLAKVHADLRGEKPGVDGVPSAHGDGGRGEEHVAFGASWSTVA